MTEALRALGSTLHVHSVRTSSTFFHQLYSPVKKSSRCPPHEETPHLNMTTTTSTWMWVALPPTWRDFLSLRHSKVSGGTQFCTFDKENVNNNPSSSYDYCREHTPLPDICHNRHNQRWCTFFFKPVPFFAQITQNVGLFWPILAVLLWIWTFWCTFTGLNNHCMTRPKFWPKPITRPNFRIPKPWLVFRDQIFRNRGFFLRPNFLKSILRLFFPHQIFLNQNRNPQKIDKSLKTETGYKTFEYEGWRGIIQSPIPSNILLRSSSTHSNSVLTGLTNIYRHTCMLTQNM